MGNGLAIVGGRVVTPTGIVDGDLVVQDGLIAEIGRGAGASASDTIDAIGCLVLPGGVEPHSHALTDLAAAGIAAAHGGTTTILTFTLPRPGESPTRAFVRARDELVPRCVVDVGIHGSYFDPNDVPIHELRREGVLGLQVFLAFPELGLMFDDGQLYRMLRETNRLGLLVQVQCENGALIEALTAELVAAGSTGVRFYPASRPGAVEDEAVARVLAIAALADAPVYLVHLSTGISVELARVAKARGVRAIVEVCTHHLVLDDSAYRRPDADLFVVGPPLRPADDVEALWRAIADGTVETVGSDHSHMALRPSDAHIAFTEAPMGLPGMELRVPLVLSEGLRRGVPIETLVDVLATGPARAFGLYPRKGALAVGSDADIVVWDTAARSVVHASELHDGLGHTPYEGIAIDGAVRCTIVRGRTVMRDGILVGEPVGGRFVASTQGSESQRA